MYSSAGSVWAPNTQNSPLACLPSPEASLHLPACTRRHQPAYKGRLDCSERYWAKTIWFSHRQVFQTKHVGFFLFVCAKSNPELHYIAKDFRDVQFKQRLYVYVFVSPRSVIEVVWSWPLSTQPMFPNMPAANPKGTGLGVRDDCPQLSLQRTLGL